MNHGIKTIIYPVTDLAKATATFRKLLGVEPEVNSPYYVGFKVGDMDIGLDPRTHRAGVTAYYHVDDIRAALQALLDAGAQVVQDVRDVAQGRLTASVKDADGNLIGLLQDPKEG